MHGTLHFGRTLRNEGVAQVHRLKTSLQALHAMKLGKLSTVFDLMSLAAEQQVQAINSYIQEVEVWSV